MTPTPPGFRCHRRGKAALIVAAEFEAAVLEGAVFERLASHEQRGVGLGAEYGADEACVSDGHGGRGRNRIIELPGRPERLHLRPFHHGGFLRSLTRERLASPRRAVAELAVAARLAAKGAPVARPVLAFCVKRGPCNWTALVGSLHEEATRDGIAFFASAPARERILAASAATGRALRAFHDAGGRHADLHLGNVLLRERDGPPEIIFIDLDRARVATPVPPRRRSAEMARLFRSLHKRGAVEATTADVVGHFFEAYCDRDAELRAALVAHLPRERIRVALHRAAYRARPRAR